MSHVKQKLFAVGTLAMALPLASLAGQSAFASTPASANGMSGFIYKCVVKNYNEQTGETDTEPLFTEEQLASIKTLTCVDADYTSSDIENWSQGLNKLIGLETLNFRNGNYGTFMTGTLDLSFAPNLKNVDITGNFSEINVSQNAELTNFKNLTSQELTTIDVSHNPKLKNLALHNNKLTNIDLSNNLLLESLSLEGTKISSLDLSQNSKLEILNLYCVTVLTALDISNNTKLRSINIDQTAIETLNVENQESLRNLVADGQTILSTARAKKSNDNYEMNVSSIVNLELYNGIKWQPKSNSHYQYDEQTGIITFSDINSVLAEGGITFVAETQIGTKTLTLSLRPVDIDIIIFVNGEKLPNYSMSDNVKFVGDTWSTDDYTNIIDGLYGEALSLCPTKLASVIARTRATATSEYIQIGEDFGTEDSTPKLSGTLEDIERIALIYNYDIVPASPDTGHNTKQSESLQTSSIIAISTSAICTTFAIFFIIRRHSKHNKTNRF